MTVETLEIDNLVYAIKRSTRRTTLGLAIERDGSLTISAPASCDRSAIEKFERDKRLWVHTKLAGRELLFRNGRVREYVSGECFHYLGRSHRLKIDKNSSDQPLRLIAGRFMLRHDEVKDADRHFREWYVAHGRSWIGQRVEQLSDRVGAESKSIRVMSLGHRWGSCTPDGTLNFNYRLMCLPRNAIEYVIVHEMVHLKRQNHDSEFWSRLERVLPDARSTQAWIAQHGGEYV